MPVASDNKIIESALLTGREIGAPRPMSASLVRARDVSVSLLLLTLLAPLMALLALAARMSTGGSSLFWQTRVGEGGKSIRVAKFRTLLPDAPCEVQKLEAEHLATRIGTLMRRSKLDELPQLWNVLKGEMTLVGPRPILSDEYGQRSHYDRLLVRPGLTGLWQVSPARGHRFDSHPEYDRFYLAHRGLVLDLWLMWRTIVLVSRGLETTLEQAERHCRQAKE